MIPMLVFESGGLTVGRQRRRGQDRQAYPASAFFL